MSKSDGIEPWKTGQSWKDYRGDILLWSEATSLDASRQCAHVLYKGFKPYMARYFRIGKTMMEFLRTQPKQADFEHTDENVRRLVRECKPIERLILFMDAKLDYNDILHAAKRSLELFKIERSANETFEDFLSRFELALEEVKRDGEFVPSERQICLSVFFNLKLNNSQSEGLRNHFDLRKAGEAGKSFERLQKLVRQQLGSTGAGVVVDEDVEMEIVGYSREQKGGKGGKQYRRKGGKRVFYADDADDGWGDAYYAEEDEAELEDDVQNGGGPYEAVGGSVTDGDYNADVAETDGDSAWLAFNQCRKCMGYGHWEKDCKSKKGGNKGKGKGKRDKGSTNKGFAMFTCFAAFPVTFGCVDSGCSASCVSDCTLEKFRKEFATAIKKVQPANGAITFGDGNEGQILERVTVGTNFGDVGFNVFKTDQSIGGRVPFLLGTDFLADKSLHFGASPALEHRERQFPLRKYGGLFLIALTGGDGVSAALAIINEAENVSDILGQQC